MLQTEFLVNGVKSGALSPLDRGFAYGDGVFRTMKVAQGMPQHWPAHYQTLVHDCSAIGIVCPSAELLVDEIAQLAVAHEVCVVKIIITRGEGARGYAPPAITTPTRVVMRSPMPQFAAENSLNGIHLTICKTQLSHQPQLAGVKTLNRLENVLARMEWNDPNIVDGVLLDVSGNIIECTSGNLFARFGDVLATPSLHLCGVKGAMRHRILEIAPTLGLKPQEMSFDLAQLSNADEVIYCNSLCVAWQVLAVAQFTFSNFGLAEKIRYMLK